MTRYRNRKEPYSRDIYRYSIYPRIPRPSEAGERRLRPGDVFEVEIIDIDEKGRGVAKYRNLRVLVYGGATVGDRVRVKVEKVLGEQVIARVSEWA